METGYIKKLASNLTKIFALALGFLTWVLLPLLILLSIAVAMTYTFITVLIAGFLRLLGLGKRSNLENI